MAVSKSRFKTGICSDCGTDSKPQILYAKGLCPNHYWYRSRVASKKNSSEFLVNQNSNQPTKQELQNWFNYHVTNSGTVCENCQNDLYFFDNTIAYSCQAHIIPKALFKSVSANIYNHLTLGGLAQNCNCHGQYDTNWSNAEKLPVFEIAKSRFLLFKDQIAKPELKKLPECFAKYL